MRTRLSMYTLLVALLSLSLAACQGAIPTSTQTLIPSSSPLPTPLPPKCNLILANNTTGLAILNFPDGIEIQLGENTEIEFIPAGYCPYQEQDQVILHSGQLAVHAQIAGGENIIITSQDNFVASLNETGLVTYDVTLGAFHLLCTNGSCALGTTLQNMNPLACGETGSLDRYGSFIGPSPIDPISLTPFADWLQSSCIQTLVTTPLPPLGTPDREATATAACADFHNQFPLTPCPTNQP